MAPRKKAIQDRSEGEDFRSMTTLRKKDPLGCAVPIYELRKRQTNWYAFDPHRDPALEVECRGIHGELARVIELDLHAQTLEEGKLELQRLKRAQQIHLSWLTAAHARQGILYLRTVTPRLSKCCKTFLPAIPIPEESSSGRLRLRSPRKPWSRRVGPFPSPSSLVSPRALPRR